MRKFIAIIGAHSTGKTTLSKSVEQELKRVERSVYRHESSSPRKFASAGHLINDEVTGATQMLITFEHLSHLLANPAEYIVTDRFVADNLAYTRLGNCGRDVEEIHERFLSYLLYFFGSKILWIYVPIEFSLVPDGVRHPNPEFQQQVDKEIQNIIDHYGIPVRPVTGNVEDRTLQVLDLLKMPDWA